MVTFQDPDNIPRGFFRRVLRPGGALVLSRLHPTGGWLRHGGSYFDVRLIHERLLEPRPVPEAAVRDPEDYEQLGREPRGFVAVRVVPRPAARLNYSVLFRVLEQFF
jgi:hypothetical protein